MEITPRELRDVEIAEAFRGYNREVVNDLLERAAAAIEGNGERVRELTEHLNAAQLEADRSRETEDILHRTLLLAQRAADEAVAEAQQKAREMMEEAELESHKLLADAQSEAQRRRDEERERLEEEVIDLAARRDTLLADVDTLTKFESDYRERIAGVLEADLDALRSRESAQPGPVPELQAVELPMAAEAVFRAEPSAADAASDTEPADSESFTESTAESGTEAGVPEPALSPWSEIEVETYVGTVTEDEPGEDDPNGFTSVSTPDADATREVDVTALFDAESADPAPGVSAWTPAPEPEPAFEAQMFTSEATSAAEPEAHTDSGFDMLRPDVLDAEVLDDDAFFATLREAVHDDTPLGPRDEIGDDADIFGEEGERSSFRDVFRRRR